MSAMIRTDSLAARLTLILLAAMLLPAALIGWLAYDQLVDTIKTERIRAVGRVADTRHEQLVMLFQQSIVRSQGFLADLGRRCGTQPSSRCGLAELQVFLDSEGALGATLKEPGGRHRSLGDSAVAASEVPTFSPGQLAQFTDYAAGVERRYFIVVIDPYTGREMSVTYPVRMIQPIFDLHRDLGEAGENFLSDHEGLFVTRARYLSVQGHSHPVSAKPMLRCLQAENGETLDLDYRDAPIIHGFRFIPEIGGGCIMAHSDQAETFAPIAALKTNFLLALLLFTALAIAAARVLARRIAAPVRQLASVTHSIAAGDLGARASTLGYDEVAELGSSFNAMTDQLVALNAGLEQRVAQRIVALRESEQRFRQLFNAGSDAIFVVEFLPDGCPGNLVEVNDIACERFGYRRDELLQMRLDDIEAPEAGGTAAPEFLRQLHESGQATIERVHLTKDGRRIPVEISIHLFRLAGKDAMLGVARDISARKQAEGDLRKLALALEQCSENIVITNLAAEIEFVNESFVRNTGYSRKELIGQNPRILNAGKTPRQTFAALWEALTNGRAWHGELYNRRKDGSDYIESASIVPLRQADGLVSHYVAVKEEITERKRAEVRLRQALLDAEAATRAKSDFLAHMSHEIRTPINAIVGAARLIETESLTVHQRGYSKIMQHASRSLLALIDDILDLSKIESGQIALSKTTFDLAELIAGLVSVASMSALEKKLEIRVHLMPNLPQFLIGDPHRLEQVLNNLLSNAIKFTSKGEIRLRVQQLSAKADEVRLLFALSDSGIGIARDKLDAVFYPFVQAESTTTRTHGGTGLGLSISRQLVALMGGSIGVESVLGQGSDFVFTAIFALPSATEKDACAERSAAQKVGTSAQPLAGRRVLLVEDNAFNRVVTEGMLQQLGIEVDVAVDGQDGVECFQIGSDYDAVLMDLHLPGLDGFACAQAIRALPEGRQVPIIAFTANVLSTTIAKCRQTGMDDYLLKPVVPETLRCTLEHWILGEPSALRSQAQPVNIDAADRIPDKLPGIDRAKASAWSNGSARALAKLLERMLSHTGDDPGKLARYLAAGDLEAAALITHDLMGVAATVGASALVSAARQLNREIRSENPDSRRVQEAIDGIGAAFAQLNAAQAILQQGLGMVDSASDRQGSLFVL